MAAGWDPAGSLLEGLNPQWRVTRAHGVLIFLHGPSGLLGASWGHMTSSWPQDSPGSLLGPLGAS
eukprot:3531754-Pyramimonas_sp.AAC.1